MRHFVGTENLSGISKTSDALDFLGEGKITLDNEDPVKAEKSNVILGCKNVRK